MWQTANSTVMLTTKPVIANGVYSKMQTSQETSHSMRQRQEACCAYLDHTRVATSQGLLKQTTVSHSSAEAVIISLDADLRMEGTPALNSWDTVIEVLHPKAGSNSLREPPCTGRERTQPMICSET